MDCAMAPAPRLARMLRRSSTLQLQRAALQTVPCRLYPRTPLPLSLPATTRCAAINFPQEWLEEKRAERDEWKASDRLVQTASSKSQNLSFHLLQNAFGAIMPLLRLTLSAVRLARSLVADVRRALWWQERRARAQHLALLAAEAARREQEMLAAQRRAEQRERFKEAGDPQFLALLHSMDDPSIPLETKWSGIQAHLRTKEEFGKHLSQLFTLAGESSKAVQGLSIATSSFWKSELTQSVIAQEEALKRHLYLQMLRGSAPA